LVLDIPTQQRPIDCAISPDGRYGVVRTGSWHQSISDGRIYVIDLQHTPSPAVVVDAPQPYSMFFYSSRALDFVEDYCISLGGYDPNGNAISGHFKLGPQYLPPNQPFTLSNSLGGQAQDVCTTFDLATGFPIGAAAGIGLACAQLKTGPGLATSQVPLFSDASGLIPGWGTRLSDSIKVVGNKFIRLENYVNPGFGPGFSVLNHGFVGLGRIDLNTGVQYAFSASFGPSDCVSNPLPGNYCGCIGSTCLAPAHNRAVHDVTLTPDGRLAVVSGFQLYGVYDMTTLQEVVSAQRDPITQWSGSQPQLPEVGFYANPFMRVTCDSVEATNTRAVIVGGVWPGPSCGSGSAKELSAWRVAILNLRSKEDVTFEGPMPPNGSCDGSAASDVAITPNGQWAIMSTRNGAYRIALGGAGWPPPAPEPYTDGIDSLDVNGSSAFVSDAVACTNTRAVVVGRHFASGQPQVLVIDPNQTPGSPSSTIGKIDIPEPVNPLGTPYRLVPTDVEIDPTERWAVVRCAASDLSAKFGSISVIDLATGNAVGHFQSVAIGFGFALEQVCVSKDFALVVGEDGQPGFSPVSSGRIQVIKL
jgi:hypothetical protein